MDSNNSCCYHKRHRLILYIYSCYYERKFNIQIINEIKNIIASYCQPNRYQWKTKPDYNKKLIKFTNYNSTASISVPNTNEEIFNLLFEPNVVNLDDMLNICKERNLKMFFLEFDFEINANSSMKIGFCEYDVYKTYKDITNNNWRAHCSLNLKNGSNEIGISFADDGWSFDVVTLQNNVIIGNNGNNIQRILFGFEPASNSFMTGYSCSVYFSEGTYSKDNFECIWAPRQSLLWTSMDWCQSQIVPYCSIKSISSSGSGNGDEPQMAILLIDPQQTKQVTADVIINDNNDDKVKNLCNVTIVSNIDEYIL